MWDEIERCCCRVALTIGWAGGGGRGMVGGVVILEACQSCAYCLLITIFFFT